MFYLSRNFCNLRQLGLAFFVQYTVAASTSCRPVEEHHSTTLSYTWLTPDNNRALEVSWFKDATVVSRCDSTPQCVDFIRNSVRTTAKGINATVVHISLSIDNVTLSASGVWRLQYVGLERNDILTSCYLQAYSKGKSVNCRHLNLYTGCSIIQCSVERIYPKALCKAIVRNNGGMCVNSKILNVTNEEILQDLKHYTSTCCVEVNYQVDRKWRFDVLIFVYPNVTGDAYDAQYGINETVSVEINEPTDMSKICLDTSENKRCNCETAPTNREHTTDVFKDIIEFTNKIITTTKYVHENDSSSANCVNTESGDYIIVTCSTNSIYRLKDCQFYYHVNEIRQKMKGDIISILDKPNNFSVQECQIRLPKKQNPEYVYHGNVRMILESSGHETIAIGNFSLEIKNNKTEKQLDEESFHLMLILGLSITALICCSCLVTFLLLKKTGILRERLRKKRVTKRPFLNENVQLEEISNSKVSLHIYESVQEDEESLVKGKWLCL